MNNPVQKSLLIVLLMLFGLGGSAFGQDAGTATDNADLPYQVKEIHQLIDEARNEPTEKNQYVRDWMSENDFPVKESAENRKKWIAKHENAIEELLIARKKNFDKYH